MFSGLLERFPSTRSVLSVGEASMARRAKSAAADLRGRTRDPAVGPRCSTTKLDADAASSGRYEMGKTALSDSE